MCSFASSFQMAKLAKMKIPPCELFRSETDKYSTFDETVIFTSFPFSFVLLLGHCR